MIANAEHVILVDANDLAIGQEEKLTAHQQGLMHRAFSIFIFRDNNGTLETLLQQRRHDKYHSGDLWTNSCCSHPRPGETILAAGKRRLKEEMGIITDLHEIAVFHYVAPFANGLTENEIDHVLVGFSDEKQVAPNPKEVADHRWLDLNSLQMELTQQPEKFTAWFGGALEQVKIHLDAMR